MLPPEPCPPEILLLVEGAACLHNNGQYDAALEAYLEAQEHWEEHLGSSSNGQVSGAVAAGDIHQGLYFCLATGSVLLSAGRYEEALERYEGADAEAEKLPEGHPNRAVVRSCRAFALNALSRLDLAFEELVKVWEICVENLGNEQGISASLGDYTRISLTHSSDPLFPSALTVCCLLLPKPHIRPPPSPPHNSEPNQ